MNSTGAESLLFRAPRIDTQVVADDKVDTVVASAFATRAQGLVVGTVARQRDNDTVLHFYRATLLLSLKRRDVHPSSFCNSGQVILLRA